MIAFNDDPKSLAFCFVMFLLFRQPEGLRLGRSFFLSNFFFSFPAVLGITIRKTCD